MLPSSHISPSSCCTMPSPQMDAWPDAEATNTSIASVRIAGIVVKPRIFRAWRAGTCLLPPRSMLNLKYNEKCASVTRLMNQGTSRKKGSVVGVALQSQSCGRSPPRDDGSLRPMQNAAEECRVWLPLYCCFIRPSPPQVIRDGFGKKKLHPVLKYHLVEIIRVIKA